MQFGIPYFKKYGNGAAKKEPPTGSLSEKHIIQK